VNLRTLNVNVGEARLVIKQIIHLDMLKQSGQFYNFGFVPTDEWRDVVTACRRQEKDRQILQT
jgi:hypothetical protein